MFLLDGMLFGFLLLSSSSVFQLGFGSGRKEFYFPTFAKPCPLCATLLNTLLKMKNFDKQTFLISTVLVGLLLVPCFFAAWGDDEGTLGTNLFWITLSKLFYVLRFPTHTLLWELFSFNGLLFIGGLVVNCMFYGLIIERTATILKLTKTKA